MLLYPDRVRAHTAAHVNAKIDRCIEENVQRYSGMTKADISRRIEQLEREWDIERVIQVNAPAITLTGLALGIFHNRRWLALPVGVMSFLLLHGVQGWCPPIPVLRRLGFRTRDEINAEKYALKALRGDFDDLPKFTSQSPMPRAEAAMIASSL
jgi:hypothetical protein